ncbi:TPA: hypothetical protein EYP45_01835, partial [Candidatus Peregrinibacteria bacterium]|nr:hypothetical protein [Candidatus Peregrinibacteria bacterium]
MAENKQILEGRQNELEVGTSVSFFVGEDNNNKIAEGEIIGLEGSKATVVYIAPSGEYSIDKFELKDLSPNGESLKLSENPDEKKVSTQEELLNKDKENEENEELEKKQEKHIQSIKNTLMTIFNVTISDKTDQTKKQIAEHKENIIIKINEIIDSTEINAENISEITDHDITILSENLDFINELIFASFIDYSIATSEKKPSTLVIEEIKTRISHFDTQAKALRDKKITEINQELYNSRSTDEKKYPKPFEMMNIGILTDERAKKLNIDITHQKIFNRILEREKNERDNIINPLVQKIVKRRKDLSILLKEDYQNLSKKNTEFTKTIPELSTMLLSMENENGTLQATETMHDIVYKQLADIDNPK